MKIAAVALALTTAFCLQVFTVHSTLAQNNDPGGAIDDVSNGLADPGDEIGEIASSIAIEFLPIINTVAAVFVVVSGISMVLAQSEDRGTTARRAFIAGISSILLVNLAAPWSQAIFGAPNAGPLQDPEGAADDVGFEIIGVLEYIQIPLATIAVLFIIISGIRAVLAWGNDEGLRQLRRTVISSIIGFTLIAIRLAFRESFTETGSPIPLIQAVVAIVNTFLGFLALIAVAIVIYAGILMIVNIGNDEQYKRARDILIRVAIGILVIAVSWAIVNIFFEGAAV